MNIIKIEKNEYGGHENISADYLESVLGGWAVIPEDVGTPDTLENYPFGDIEVEEKDGVMTVTKWIAGEMPEPMHEPPSEFEQLRADVDYIAIMAGVEL